MLVYLMFLNWMFSILFMFLNHPLSLGAILLIQTILISLMSGFFYFNFWFSYILFLIMIGGMLVMFIYMTSIASNEKFNMPKNTLIFFSLKLFILMFYIMLTDNYYSIFSMNFINLYENINNMINFNKFFSHPNMYLMINLMVYLLVTLIAVVKIVGKKMNPLRQK